MSESDDNDDKKDDQEGEDDSGDDDSESDEDLDEAGIQRRRELMRQRAMVRVFPGFHAKLLDWSNNFSIKTLSKIKFNNGCDAFLVMSYAYYDRTCLWSADIFTSVWQENFLFL